MTKISDFLPDDRLPDNRIVRIVDRGRPRFVTPTRSPAGPAAVTGDEPGMATVTGDEPGPAGLVFFSGEHEPIGFFARLFFRLFR
jgi:hypothetical protein